MWESSFKKLMILGLTLKKNNLIESWWDLRFYIENKRKQNKKHTFFHGISHVWWQFFHIATVWPWRSIRARVTCRWQTQTQKIWVSYKERIWFPVKQMLSWLRHWWWDSRRHSLYVDCSAMAWKTTELFWNKHLSTLSRSTLLLDVLN